jgi:hypothetical protein
MTKSPNRNLFFARKNTPTGSLIYPRSNKSISIVYDTNEVVNDDLVSKGLMDLFGVTAWHSGIGWSGKTRSQLCSISIKPMITRSCGTVACTERSAASAASDVRRISIARYSVYAYIPSNHRCAGISGLSSNPSFFAKAQDACRSGQHAQLGLSPCL